MPPAARTSQTRQNAEWADLAATVREKLLAMEEMSRERAKTTDTILLQIQHQQAQISQLVTDMAVLRTQHESFWKGATALFAVLSLVGGAIGWAIATAVPFFTKGH